MARAILRDRKLGWIRSFLTRLLSRHALGAYGNSAAVSASASSSHSQTFAPDVVGGCAEGAGRQLVLFVVELDVPEALSSEVGICGDGAPSSGGERRDVFWRRYRSSVSYFLLIFSGGRRRCGREHGGGEDLFSGADSCWRRVIRERVLISSRNRAGLTSFFAAVRFGDRGGDVVGGRHVSPSRCLK